MALFRLFKQSMGRWLMMLLLLMLTSVTARAAEAYANYTPSNTTLTFYYDNQRSTRPGTTYDLNLGSSGPSWWLDGTCANVTKVVFNSSFANARPTSTCSWFYNMRKIESITGLSYLNTSYVTNMRDMFNNCSGLTNLDLSGFDTYRVTDMYSMFADCSGLTSLDLSSFNTSKVTNMAYMFDDCSGLTSLDLSSFTAFNVTDMRYMFSGCSGLTSLDLSYIYTYNVTDMSYMFYGCSGLKNLDLRGFNTYKVTDMSYMFSGCSGLTSLDLSSFDTSDVTSMFSMFDGCSSLRTIFAGEEWNTEAVMSSSYMFHNNNNLIGGLGTTYNGSNPKDKAYAHIDGGASNPGYFTAAGTQAYAVYTPENTTLTFYYDTERSSRPGTKYNLTPDSNDPGWYTDTTYANVTNVVFDPSFANARPTSTYKWFYGMRNLQSFTGLSNLNTSEVTNMSYMFCYCTRLTSLDLSHFNTSKVTFMYGMFYGSSGLTSLDLSSFNTTKVTGMTNVFVYCSNLRTITVGSDWSTSAVTSSSNMFNNNTSLVGGMGTTYNDSNPKDKAYAHIDGGASNPGYFTAAGTQAYAVYTPENTTLTFYYDTERSSRTGKKYNLNTSGSNPAWYTDGTYANVTRVVFDPSFAGARPTTTYSWFYEMQNLQTITGIEHLNTSEVISLSQMFFRCNKLTSIDVSHFNTSKLKTLWAMFYNCSGLTSLDLSSFNTSMVTNTGYMFNSCSNLRTIYVGEGWSTAAVTGSVSMFTDCSSLVGGMGTVYDANHVDKAYAHIDGGVSDPGYFTAAGIEAYACYTPENTTLTFYYDTERGTRPGTTYDLNTGMNTPAWRSVGSHVTQVVFDPSFANARLTTTYSWFYGMQNLQTIEGMEYLNTSEVTDMSYMFGWCTSLTSLDLSHFNTSKVTNMIYMFYYCESLTSLDLSGFNTSMVTNTGFMFYGCSNLRTITVGSDWSTDAVTNSSLMFSGCSSLVGGQGTVYNSSHIDKTYAHIDGGASDPGYFTAAGTEAYACYTPENTTLTFYYDTERGTRPGTTYDLNTGMNTPAWRSAGSHVTQVVFDPSFAVARPATTYMWFYGIQNIQTIEGMEYLNTSEVTDMSYMFGWCTSLTSLDLSHFNTSKVTNMIYMFYYCESLTSLDLSSFNTSMVTNTGFMFYGCSNLRTIYASEGWSTEAVTNSTQMFNYATSLVGGQGTTYDANHVNKAYAHIDGGPSDPGYLTEKQAFLLGDVNGDGYVRINDVTALIDYLLSGDGSGINVDAADCNHDNDVRINDVTALIDYLLSGSW